MPWRVRPSQIVMSLQGGLGNQLFEWAFSTALVAAGKNVVFDVVRCRGDRPLMVGELVPQELRIARPVGMAFVLAEKRGILTEHSPIRLVRQRRSGFDQSVQERLTRESYLLGYFQSPHYFASTADTVRTSVTALVHSMLTTAGRELARGLAADPQSVAVHVRRGDYVSDSSAAARHGALGQDYYDRALAHLDSIGLRNRIWFGDDLEWIRENLAREGDLVCPPDATTADGGEIALMASCSSRVIANSSFSWWAGWLGAESTAAHPVIAPIRWFADDHSDAAQLVPAEWLRM